MATVARRLFKFMLFIGLCLLSARYVHPYPYEWTETQMRAWLYTSRAINIRDPEDLYFVVWVAIELIVAALAYITIMKLWVWCRTHYLNRTSGR
jgi:hypothetical protein